MTIEEAVEFYKKYVGVLSDDEIHGETGYSTDRIKYQIMTSRGQLCWYCANACDETKCEWVKNCHGVQHGERKMNYPDYVTTMASGNFNKVTDKDFVYIVECSRYKWDGKSKW